jgi:hypothetical protein
LDRINGFEKVFNLFGNSQRHLSVRTDGARVGTVGNYLSEAIGKRNPGNPTVASGLVRHAGWLSP